VFDITELYSLRQGLEARSLLSANMTKLILSTSYAVTLLSSEHTDFDIDVTET